MNYSSRVRNGPAVLFKRKLTQEHWSQSPQADLRVAAAAATLQRMRTFTAVVERDPQTKLFVGYIPGFSGAHSQGTTLEELRANLREVIAMLLEDGEPELEAEFVGTEAIQV